MNAIDVIEGRAEWSVDVDDSSEWVRDLPEGSVHQIITSPPYYGLRDYAWVGGDPQCPHGVTNEHQKQGATSIRKGRANVGAQRNESFVPDCVVCSKCGAHRIAGQIGLEETPDEYVERLVRLFRRARRALHPTGTLWLNLGDSYANDGKWGGHTGGKHVAALHCSPIGRNKRYTGLKPKDLIGIPWRVAFALQADGWYLRQWCPWVKRNPMPSSADDRPGTACETIFLLTKEADYFFDMEAVRTTAIRIPHAPGNKKLDTSRNDSGRMDKVWAGDGLRNFRSADLWFESVGMLIHDGVLLGFDAPLKGYKGAHFATFPDRLVRPMILAGTSAKGVCSKCAAPWTRLVEKERVATRPGIDTKVTGDGLIDGNRDPERHITITKTIGWEPGCQCGAGLVPAVVMDPFTGSGTTGEVARSHGRRFVGCDLNPDYVAMACKRIGNADPGLF